MEISFSEPQVIDDGVHESRCAPVGGGLGFARFRVCELARLWVSGFVQRSNVQRSARLTKPHTRVQLSVLVLH